MRTPAPVSRVNCAAMSSRAKRRSAAAATSGPSAAAAIPAIVAQRTLRQTRTEVRRQARRWQSTAQGCHSRRTRCWLPGAARNRPAATRSRYHPGMKRRPRSLRSLPPRVRRRSPRRGPGGGTCMRERTKSAIGTACRAIVATIAGRVAAGGRCCTLLVIALAFGALAACGSARESALPAGTAVLVIGDSITAGYGVQPDEAWPANLARSTGWNVVAAGVSGERSGGGRRRLPELLDLHAPSLVIIELGGND